MTKVHIDDLIGCHVVGCSKPAKHWFVTKLCPEIYTKEEYLKFSLKSFLDVTTKESCSIQFE